MKNKKSQIKKKKEEPWKWTKKGKANKQEPCTLIQEIQAELNKIVSLMEIFELVTDLEKLINLTIAQTNFILSRKE